MNLGFERIEEGVRVRLTADDAAVLRTFIEQLMALIDQWPDVKRGWPDLEGELGGLVISDHASTPEDPVLARLFPDAYRDDAEAAGEFRRYTEAGLRDGKRLNAQVVLDSLRPGEITLDGEQAQAWLRILNDIRLALGTLLDITEEYGDQIAGLAPGGRRYQMLVEYDWLTVLQHSLVEALW